MTTYVLIIRRQTGDTYSLWLNTLAGLRSHGQPAEFWSGMSWNLIEQRALRLASVLESSSTPVVFDCPVGSPQLQPAYKPEMLDAQG